MHRRASINRFLAAPTPAYMPMPIPRRDHYPICPGWSITHGAVLGDDCVLIRRTLRRAQGPLVRRTGRAHRPGIGSGCPLPPRTNTTFQRDFSSQNGVNILHPHLGLRSAALRRGQRRVSKRSRMQRIPDKLRQGRGRDAAGMACPIVVDARMAACAGCEGGYKARFWARCFLLLLSWAERGAGWLGGALVRACEPTRPPVSMTGVNVSGELVPKRLSTSQSASEPSQFTPSMHHHWPLVPQPRAIFTSNTCVCAARCSSTQYTCFMLFSTAPSNPK